MVSGTGNGFNVVDIDDDFPGTLAPTGVKGVTRGTPFRLALSPHQAQDQSAEARWTQYPSVCFNTRARVGVTICQGKKLRQVCCD